jgi:drug/metabolite transporter (DMT)-like permease
LPPDRRHPPNWIAFAPPLFVVLWATGFVVARTSAGHVEPFTFLAIRFPIAGALFAAIALGLRAPWPSLRGGLHGAVAGALIHGVYLGPIYWAVARGLPAGVSALIISLQPVMTAILATWMVGERIAARHWLGLALGIAGVALVIWPKLAFAAEGMTPINIAACVVGAIGSSLGAVYQKRFATGFHLASGGVWQYAGAAALVGLVALFTEDFGFDASLQAWGALAWSVLVISLGAISLLMLLIRHGDVSRVAALNFLSPGVASVMTYFLFGERLNAVQLAGMAVSAAAVLLVTRSVVRRA